MTKHLIKFFLIVSLCFDGSLAGAAAPYKTIENRHERNFLVSFAADGLNKNNNVPANTEEYNVDSPDFWPQSAGSCTEIVLSLTTDNYGSETSWEIKDAEDRIIHSGSNYSNNQTYSEQFCLEDGTYTFIIYDSYGDGICCSWGNGLYTLALGSEVLGTGDMFGSSESKSFTVGGAGEDNSYYASANGLTGYALKSALHGIINDHNPRGYGNLWGFYNNHELDRYYEDDGTILDIYSEYPSGGDNYNYTKTTGQCGSYSGEGDCYNREHSFPRSWFGGSVEPMNSDVHHIFATDGFVNGRRSSYPYGEVGSADYISSNGCRLGPATTGSGYSGTVFEPIDEFKGDIARAQFYMATRYENIIGNWEGNSTYSDAVLDGSFDKVFEGWQLDLLLNWHQLDPVSQKEFDRNEAAFLYQGNRNPFIDHPEFVELIWSNGSSAAREMTSTVQTVNSSGEEHAALQVTYSNRIMHATMGNNKYWGLTIYDSNGRRIAGRRFSEPKNDMEIIVNLETDAFYVINFIGKNSIVKRKFTLTD